MSISSETLHKNLKDIFGFNSFKGKQEQINEEDNEMLNEIFRDFKHPKRTLH